MRREISVCYAQKQLFNTVFAHRRTQMRLVRSSQEDSMRAVWAGCGMCAHADAPGGMIVLNACVDSGRCAIV